MVSFGSLAAMSLTLLVCFALPITLFVWVRRRSISTTGAVIAGALAFYISQMVLRIPLLQLVLPRWDWYQDFMRQPLPYFLFLSLTAALFEETARLGVFRFLLTKRQTWLTGVAYGIGHGGIEAMLMVGMTYVNNIVLSVMINNGTFHSFVANRVDAATAEGIFTSLTTTSVGLFLAAGVERMLVIAIQIALSVMILAGITKKRVLPFYGAAVALHTAINFVAAYMMYVRVHFWLIELFIAVCAVLALLYIRRAKADFPRGAEPLDEAEQAVREGY